MRRPPRAGRRVRRRGALPGNCGRTPGRTPRRGEIFKAGDEECAALLAELTPVRLAAGRLKTLEADTGETLGGEFGALFDWLAACLERGSVEEYEFRVSCY